MAELDRATPPEIRDVEATPQPVALVTTLPLLEFVTKWYRKRPPTPAYHWLVLKDSQIVWASQSISKTRLRIWPFANRNRYTVLRVLGQSFPVVFVFSVTPSPGSAPSDDTDLRKQVRIFFAIEARVTNSTRLYAALLGSPKPLESGAVARDAEQILAPFVATTAKQWARDDLTHDPMARDALAKELQSSVISLLATRGIESVGAFPSWIAATGDDRLTLEPASGERSENAETTKIQQMAQDLYWQGLLSARLFQQVRDDLQSGTLVLVERSRQVIEEAKRRVEYLNRLSSSDATPSSSPHPEGSSAKPPVGGKASWWLAATLAIIQEVHPIPLLGLATRIIREPLERFQRPRRIRTQIARERQQELNLKEALGKELLGFSRMTYEVARGIAGRAPHEVYLNLVELRLEAERLSKDATWLTEENDRLSLAQWKTLNVATLECHEGIKGLGMAVRNLTGKPDSDLERGVANIRQQFITHRVEYETRRQEINSGLIAPPLPKSGGIF